MLNPFRILVNRLGLYLALGVPTIGVALLLAVGTDTLVALGLSRSLAGNLMTVTVIALVIMGMYYFATNVIDWE